MPSEQQTTDAQPVPPAPSEPPDVHLRTRVLRADWWRAGSPGRPDNPPPHLDMSKPSDADEPDTGVDADATEWCASKDTADTSKDTPDSGEDDGVPRWDPTHLATRAATRWVQRGRDEERVPLPDRARHAVQAVSEHRANVRGAVSTGAGVALTWWTGVTPWLIDATDDAPIGVLIALALVAWLIKQRWAGTLCAWPTAALAHTCVLVLILH